MGRNQAAPRDQPARADGWAGDADRARLRDGLKLSQAEAERLAVSARLHPRLIEWAVGQLHERDFERVLKVLVELKSAGIQEALDEMLHKTTRQMAAQAANGAQAEALLGCLTWLRGGFTLAAAAALKPDTIQDEEALEEALVTLTRWRFVRYDRVVKRYRVDELVREVVGGEGSGRGSGDLF